MEARVIIPRRVTLATIQCRHVFKTLMPAVIRRAETSGSVFSFAVIEFVSG